MTTTTGRGEGDAEQQTSDADPTGRRGHLEVIAIASQGATHSDAVRIRELLADLEPVLVDFKRDHKLQSAVELTRELLRRRCDVIVVEGTGLGVTLPVMAVSALRSTPYVISTGDAIAAYWALKRRWLWLPGLIYETVLYRRAAAVIGWTPYLVGRALTLGAKRAMTAPGWAPTPQGEPDGQAIRRRLNIPDEAIVFGLVGSLNWNSRYGYCYGYELVAAVKQTKRPDVHVIIVGDGDGRDHLAALSDGDPRIHLPGQVPRNDVPSWLAAFDVASLPQSCDGVGAFRYSTKLPEYLAAGLCVVTSQIPAAYDLDEGRFIRLPGSTPWSPEHLEALRQVMERLAVPDRSRTTRPSPTGPGDLPRRVLTHLHEIIDPRQDNRPPMGRTGA
jgi:glycosyltransferase involved in cell wall biosynthesis